MKKLACFGALLCLAFTVFMAIPSMPAVAAEGEAIVYVYDEQEWDLSVYCWNADGDFGPGWPGTSLSRVPEMGENWYSFTMPSDPTGKGVTMIIFDSVNDQVNRINVPYAASRPYIHTYAQSSFATPEAAVADAIAKRPLLVETIYIYNYSDEDEAERWDNIYARCYDNKTGDELGSGVALERETSLGEHWYKYDLPAAARAASAADYRFRARVEISDGESGRESLVIVAPVEATKYYNTYREYGFDAPNKASAEEFNCVYSDPATGTTRLYFYNTQRWKSVYAYSYWTYVGANNASVEDFGPWPGTRCKEDARENWYYIDLPQDPAKLPAGANNVGIVFNNGKTKVKDVAIANQTNVYVNYEGKLFSSYAACEAVSSMIDPLPEVDDYLMNFDNIDTTEKTDSVTEYRSDPSPSLTAPIVVLSIAAVICLGVGAVLIIFTVRRKKNDLR